MLIETVGEDKGEGESLRNGSSGSCFRDKDVYIQYTEVKNNNLRDKVTARDVLGSVYIKEVLRTRTYTSFSAVG